MNRVGNFSLRDALNNFFKHHLQLDIKSKQSRKLRLKVSLIELNTEQDENDKAEQEQILIATRIFYK